MGGILISNGGSATNAPKRGGLASILHKQAQCIESEWLALSASAFTHSLRAPKYRAAGGAGRSLSASVFLGTAQLLIL